MKQTTQNIINILNQDLISQNLLQLRNINPSFTYQETPIIEAFNEYTRIKNLILSTTQNDPQNVNYFDTISFQKRNLILTYLTNLNQQLQQIRNLSFNRNNQTTINLSNSVIQNITALADVIDGTNLFSKTIGLEYYRDETKRFSDLRIQYQNIVNDLNNLNNTKNEINAIYTQIAVKNNEILQLRNNADANIQELTNIRANIENINLQIEKYNNKVNSDVKNIEAKKLRVETFSTNIDEYKQQIDALKLDANNVIEKEKLVDSLIKSAEIALNLKSSEGISAAFSSQYEIAKNSNLFKMRKKSINLWIVGAFFFILAAIGITVWIATGHLNDNTNGISLIVARIVAVGISIAGATFCSKQYIKQKNIAEDYAYKAVLSKSIIAFTNEIKTKNEDKVAEYLTKVLSEIHQDPLRSRSENKIQGHEDGVDLLSLNNLEKIISLIQKK